MNYFKISEEKVKELFSYIESEYDAPDDNYTFEQFLEEFGLEKL